MEAASRVDTLMQLIDGLDGVDMELARDMISEYARARGIVADLGDVIEREGVMVEREVGTVNNRHVDVVENPAFATWCKATQRMTDLAAKISKFVKQGGSEARDEDPLADFVSGR